MKSFLIWCLVHSLHWAVLFGAFVEQSEGAMNALKFWVWVMVLPSLFALSEKVVAAAANKPQQSAVFRWLSMLQAWVTLGLLVWFGHPASALAWGLVILMAVLHRDAKRKYREKAANEATA